MHRFLLLVTFAALTGCLPASALHAKAYSAQSAPATASLTTSKQLPSDGYVPHETYEYMILYWGFEGTDEFIANLNALGARGWKAVAFKPLDVSNPSILLMRPKQPTASATEAPSSTSPRGAAAVGAAH